MSGTFGGVGQELRGVPSHQRINVRRRHISLLSVLISFIFHCQFRVPHPTVASIQGTEARRHLCVIEQEHPRTLLPRNREAPAWLLDGPKSKPRTLSISLSQRQERSRRVWDGGSLATEAGLQIGGVECACHNYVTCSMGQLFHRAAGRMARSLAGRLGKSSETTADQVTDIVVSSPAGPDRTVESYHRAAKQMLCLLANSGDLRWSKFRPCHSSMHTEEHVRQKLLSR